MDTCERHGLDICKLYLNTFSNGVTCYTAFTNEDVDEATW